MAFLLSANALAFQVGTPSVIHSRVSCVAPAVTMAIPWKIAGAVTVAGGAAAGATYAVKALLKKQATTQAEDSRKALASMGGMDLPSGDLLDKEVEDPFVILGDWKKISTKSGRTRYESTVTGKSQWRTPDEMPELEAAAAKK
uniref:WW domain-containing protein n=1 Tax=Phaeocystis antarctica TaxID=33657 RepID=A0A7S0HC53_9EUKA